MKDITRFISLQPEYCCTTVAGGQSQMRCRVRQARQEVFVAPAVLPREQRTDLAHVQVVATLRISVKRKKIDFHLSFFNNYELCSSHMFSLIYFYNKSFKIVFSTHLALQILVTFWSLNLSFFYDKIIIYSVN